MKKLITFLGIFALTLAFTASADSPTSLFRFNNSGVRPLISTDTVLIGGTATTTRGMLEIYDPTVGRWTSFLDGTYAYNDGVTTIDYLGDIATEGNISATNLSGTNTGDSAGHTGLVPYTGATGTLELGSQALGAASGHFTNGTHTVDLVGDGTYGLEVAIPHDSYGAYTHDDLGNYVSLLDGTNNNSIFRNTNGYGADLASNLSGGYFTSPFGNIISLAGDTYVIDATGNVSISGNVGIGTTSPWAKFAINPVAGNGNSFVIGSSTRTSFVVNNAGNIGIGTVAPTSTLQIGSLYSTAVNNVATQQMIVGSSAQSQTDETFLRLVRNTDASLYYTGSAELKLGAYNAGGSGNSYQGTRLKFALKSGANNNLGAETDVMALLGNGNVGIGIMVPLAPLHVYSSGTANTTLPGFIFTRSDTTNQTHLQHYFAGINYMSQNLYRDVGGSWFLDKNTDTGTGIVQDSRAGQGYMAFYTAPATVGAVSGMEKMRLTNAGNLGIGEVAPASKLSVSGGGSFGSGYDTTAAPANGLIVEGNIGIGTTSPYAKLSVNPVAGDAAGFVVGSSTATSFLIDNGGKVGIGTTTPVNKLTVAGDIGTYGTIPTLSSCGTSPAITKGSTDVAGEITEGSVATGCVITFGVAKTNAPFCTITSQGGLVFSYTTSNTAITITNVGLLSSTKLNYHCIANNN